MLDAVAVSHVRSMAGSVGVVEVAVVYCSILRMRQRLMSWPDCSCCSRLLALRMAVLE